MPNVTDHLGNEFPSTNAMCTHYGIKMSNYVNRIKHGMSVKDALTTPLLSTKICDHLGNTYESITKMCEHYGIKVSTYSTRCKRGMTLEEALTQSTKKHPIHCEAIDHLGNKFESQIAMCEHYNITVKHFRERSSYGWSLEKILTTPIKNSKDKCTDHLGIVYSSKKDMCNHYGISPCTFAERQKKGMSLKEILLTPRQNSDISARTDHLGNVYMSKKEMCAHYNITVKRYDCRLQRGLSKEKALTNTEYYNKPVYTDHLGNTGVLAEICNIHNMSEQIVASRLHLGWSIKDALTRPNGWRADIVDHEGNLYQNNTALARTYGLNITSLSYRIKKGWSLKATLLIPTGFRIKTKTTLFENYKIIRQIDKTYYECEINNQSVIKTALQIYDDFADKINSERRTNNNVSVKTTVG